MNKPKLIKVEVLNKFQVEGRGTIIACYVPEITNYNQVSGLVGRKLFHDNKTYIVTDVEMARTGSQPKAKQIFGLLVREDIKVIKRGAPQWLKNQMKRLAKLPPPSLEKVQRQFEACKNHIDTNWRENLPDSYR